MRLTLEAKRLGRPVDHLRVALTDGRARLENRHVAQHEAGVVEEVDKDAQPGHARHTSPTLVLLHATEVGPIGGAGRMTAHGTKAVLGGREAAKRHGAIVAVKRLVIRTGSTAVGLAPVVGQAAVA